LLRIIAEIALTALKTTSSIPEGTSGEALLLLRKEKEGKTLI